MIAKPKSNEYTPFYHGYIEQIGEKEITNYLDDQMNDFLSFLKSLDHEKLSYRYAEGKWSIAEVLGHIMDVERVMSYRVLRFMRGDQTELPGFDQDLYVENGKFDQLNLADYAEEFESLRRANLKMIQQISSDQSMKMGKASGSNCSVRALLYIIGGHVTHHVAILKERYLN